MKKKLLTLFLAVALVLSNTTMAFAAETLERPVEMDGYIPTATGAEAIAATTDNDDTTVVIDLRTVEDYAQAHVKGSISLPVVLPDWSVTTDHRDAFVEYAKANFTNETKIYLLCYYGTYCVDYAAKWLTDLELPKDNIFRVTGGVVEDADLAAACVSTHADYALNAEGIILDVRATEVYYEKGYIDGSLHMPLFNRVDGSNVVTDRKDALAQNFKAYVEANRTLFESNDIYVLCNGGASGAAAAHALLAELGITGHVYTIEGGANALYGTEGIFTNQNFVSGADAVAAMDDEEVVIIDVRATKRYDAGHLRGVASYPLFTVNEADENKVTSGYDSLAKDFLAKVEANKAAFEGKDIYVLCNGGASGAKAATKLLMQAGYSNANIFTITNGAKDEDIKAAFITVPTVDTYNFVTGSDAVNADLEKVFVIDVRTEANFAKGNLANSVNWPLFNANGVSNCEDDLANAFLANVEANAAKLAGKDIYILCNSGARGAQAATKLLLMAGYDQSDIFTITNGAKGIEVRHGFLVNANNGVNPTTPVTSTQALEAIGNENIIILDVRASGNYAAGHLKGAKSQPLFDANGVVQTADADLAKAFVEYAKTIGDKEVYVLCNSGQSGARAATVLFTDAGVDLAKVHTITGGYNKNEDIKAAAIYVSDTRAVNATNDSNYLIIDVRSADKYEAGHLKNSLSLPLFDKDNNLPDDLADAFVKYVKANQKTLETKTIYILCNSGSRGAEKATALLKELGITNVFTIEGGAKSEIIKANFVVDTPADDTTDKPEIVGPETGDSANTTLYVAMMGIALVAILAVSKKKLMK